MMLQHALQKPCHAIVLGRNRLHHSHPSNLICAHTRHACKRIGITTWEIGHWINWCVWIPCLPPLPHCLDFLGLFVPNLISKGSHTWDPNIKDILTHAQGTRMVLHHAIKEAKVVGLPFWTDIMLMGRMVCLGT